MIKTDAERLVKERLGNEGSGHDWLHIDRVRKLSIQLAEGTEADEFIVELAALLHDLPDRKLADDRRMSRLEVETMLTSLSVGDDERTQIMHIIDTISFKGTGRTIPETIEGKIVQDADRLDAIGAIGIARTFIYAGSKGTPVYEPDGSDSAIQHFYDKLLKLKGLMNTDAGRKKAEERHRFMEVYLETFFKEWDR
ncbi:HD domain-containing protein [Metabacillus sp. KIGAM252]|uniref:HD domain-containing protein n=2 Tax=Metabacillus flavus TaxID=2823519 RepID=A0ABS5LF13_9BACI|nr:HD domain-containing protein [Metabacillus flavus]MBS2969324.1 HD domain-containing protein [Metabacillus flavus]